MPHDRYLLTLNSVLDFAEGNRRANRESQRAWCSLFQEIVISHRGVMTPGFIQGNEHDLAVPVLIAKCSFAYFAAAVDVGLSGQVTPCFALQRMCIESIVYAHSITQRPELGDVWILRNESEEDKKNFDAAFKITNLIRGLPAEGTVPRDEMLKVYRTTIDYGGHPNSDGALFVAGVGSTKKRPSVDVDFFSEGLPLTLALKSTAEVGYAMVRLEDLVFNVHLSPEGLLDRISVLGHGAACAARAVVFGNSKAPASTKTRTTCKT